MKTAFYYVLLFFILCSCQNEVTLTFETTTIEHQTCDDCPKILINIPKALGKAKISQTINTALEEELISLLSFDEDIEIKSLNNGIKSFENAYSKLQEQFADEPAGWEAQIKGNISYEDADYVTIALDSYLFTGGAHGYSSKQFLNFDKQKGVELENEELFENIDDFTIFAEAAFRDKENIPANESINYSGLMFEEDIFYLPENMGFTSEGLKLLYNVYEVTSFADGTIELVLPHSTIKKYLAQTPNS